MRRDGFRYIQIDFGIAQDDSFRMKTATLEMAVNWWPYALEVQASKNGLLLRPRRKARSGWAKAVRRSRHSSDNLASFRQLANKFDSKEWQW